MGQEPDENDPYYAYKKWGRDYRTNEEYWRWRNAKTDRDNESRARMKQDHTQLMHTAK